MIDIDIVTEDRHRYFLEQAYKVAAECSDDLMTKVGAVLVRNEAGRYQMFARGANILPRSVEGILSNLTGVYNQGTISELAGALSDRTWKNNNMIHAEPTVINMAKSLGYDTKGATMYMPWVPCTECGKAIVDAGIIEIIGHKDMISKTPERWWDSTNKALEELRRQGVKCFMYDGKIGNVVSTFNGEVWFP
jgi:dCMP deaminase